MPGQLPVLKPVEVIRALERAGFERQRQRGSHMMLKHPTTGVRTTGALHSRAMTTPMLAAIIKQAGLTVDDFLALL